MNVKVRCVGGAKYEITARNHKLESDQPVENNGTDAAMTPPELFLSAIGACAAYYAEEYLRVRGLPDEELEIRVAGMQGDRPVRIVSLQIDVVAPGLTQRHRDGVLRAVDACLLKNTLRVPPDINVQVLSSVDETVEEPFLVTADH